MRLELHSKQGWPLLCGLATARKTVAAGPARRRGVRPRTCACLRPNPNELLTTSPRGTTGPEGDGLLPRHWVAAVICADTPGAFSQHAVLAYCTE